MLEGLAKHNGPVKQPGWALEELDAAFPLDLARQAVARSASRRAGRRHRLRQPRHRRRPARRASSTSTSCSSWTSSPTSGARSKRRFHGAPREALLRELVRGQIGADGQRCARRRRAPSWPGSVRSTKSARRAQAFAALLAGDGRAGARAQALHVRQPLSPRPAASDRRARPQRDRQAVRRLPPGSGAAAGAVARGACPPASPPAAATSPTSSPG